MEMNDMLFKMVEQMKQIGATKTDFAINNFQHTQGTTAVITVYDQQKPDHMILDELYEWAKENNQEVKELIEELESDMSWNKDNPV